MIYGIGHDIVENERVRILLDKYGEKFINKILSPLEQDFLSTKQNKVSFIAKRFAVKEAFAKACGIGMRDPILMPRISVINDNLGKPRFEFDKQIKEWLVVHNITFTHLSISDEVYLSSAFVVLEGTGMRIKS